MLTVLASIINQWVQLPKDKWWVRTNWSGLLLRRSRPVLWHLWTAPEPVPYSANSKVESPCVFPTNSKAEWSRYIHGTILILLSQRDWLLVYTNSRIYLSFPPFWNNFTLSELFPGSANLSVGALLPHYCSLSSLSCKNVRIPGDVATVPFIQPIFTPRKLCKTVFTGLTLASNITNIFLVFSQIAKIYFFPLFSKWRRELCSLV
jgi:hypothetical protein